MRCKIFPSLGIILCTTLGFGFPTAPQQSPRFTNNRNTTVILCGNDECVNAQEELAERCEENHFPVGQRVPNFLPEGTICLCNCPGIDP